jgi:hypothetical protein
LALALGRRPAALFLRYRLEGIEAVEATQLRQITGTQQRD